LVGDGIIRLVIFNSGGCDDLLCDTNDVFGVVVVIVSLAQARRLLLFV
jgi:hypothetical protein